MIVRKVTISNFKSIYDELTLDFDQVKGFWKIEGAVGAGKTNIGEAILYGLFGDVKGKNLLDLNSWGSKKKAKVVIECFTKGHELIITRVNKGELDVLVDGEPLVFTNKKDAQNQLEEEFYDISKMTLELLCIISFNNFKSIANLNPADSRAFLDQVFGFALLSTYAEQCKNNRKIVSDEVDKLYNERLRVTSQIKKIEDISNIQKIEGESKKVAEEYTLKEQEYNTLIQQKNDALKDKQKEITQLNVELANIKNLGASVAKEIKFIEQGTCPTCGAPIDQSKLADKKKEREVLLTSYEHTNQLLKDKQLETNKIETDYLAKREPIWRAMSELKELKAKLVEQERRLSINTQEIETLKQECAQITKQWNEKNIDMEEWNQLFDTLSIDMRQLILSSFIPVLNTNIQYYTQELRLPYMIEFDNQFKCSIRLFNMDKPINIASLSTGQLKTVDMCVILGIIKVIFSGLNFNVMFLDELFSNMDNELRNSICQVLKKEINEEQTIFIVSHQEISDTNFDGSIHVQLQFADNIEKSKYEIRTI